MRSRLDGASAGNSVGILHCPPQPKSAVPRI